MQIHSPLAMKAHLLCAECLGLVGAVDPARLDYQPKPTKALLTNAGDLIIQLISQHLVKLLRVADSLVTLEAAVYALQVTYLSINALILIITGIYLHADLCC